MARKETKWTKADFGGKSNGHVFGGQNNPDEAECGGIDAEIKHIFDDLRKIGSPQNHSLNEVLAKAIAAEKALTGAKVKASGGKASDGKFNEIPNTYLRQINNVWKIKSQQLQLQSIIAVLLVSLGVVFIMSVLPSSVQDVPVAVVSSSK